MPTATAGSPDNANRCQRIVRSQVGLKSAKWTCQEKDGDILALYPKPESKLSAWNYPHRCPSLWQIWDTAKLLPQASKRKLQKRRKESLFGKFFQDGSMPFRWKGEKAKWSRYLSYRPTRRNGAKQRQPDSLHNFQFSQFPPKRWYLRTKVPELNSRELFENDPCGVFWKRREIIKLEFMAWCRVNFWWNWDGVLEFFAWNLTWTEWRRGWSGTIQWLTNKGQWSLSILKFRCASLRDLLASSPAIRHGLVTNNWNLQLDQGEEGIDRNWRRALNGGKKLHLQSG